MKTARPTTSSCKTKDEDLVRGFHKPGAGMPAPIQNEKDMNSTNNIQEALATVISWLDEKQQLVECVNHGSPRISSAEVIASRVKLAEWKAPSSKIRTFASQLGDFHPRAQSDIPYTHQHPSR